MVAYGSFISHAKFFFDGNLEMREKPKQLSGEEIFDNLSKCRPIVFGKTRFTRSNEVREPKSRKRKSVAPENDATTHGNENMDLPKGWNKFSIFFRLPYWKHLKIRHNLDVMHIEKNICDNLIGTLLQDAVKSKDGLNAREDLVQLAIRPDLHVKEVSQNKYEMPASRITMSKEEMQQFCQVLKSVKSPDGYSSNISNNVQVKERKLLNLKTHDCHVLLHQLIPVALRGQIDDDVAMVLIEFCGFFSQLCSKVIDVVKFEELEKQMIVTLCKMEMFFPPSFFTIMVHLTIHLAREAIVAGPVQYRWMYPIERYMILYYTFKCSFF